MHAASPVDRLAALKAFHKKGIFTWVSLEPTLDVESSLGIVEATHGFADLFKAGKANHLGEYSKGIDWQDYTLRTMDLCARLGVKYYIERDFNPIFPVGTTTHCRSLDTFEEPFSMSNSFAFRWQIRLALNGVANRPPNVARVVVSYPFGTRAEIWR